jgi:hypothetical protein
MSLFRIKMSITAITTARRRSVTPAPQTAYSQRILYLYSFPCLGFSSAPSFHVFRQNFVSISVLLESYMPRLSHPPCFDHR